jgi:alginate O-acetyltransferase complex protein AlgJ
MSPEPNRVTQSASLTPAGASPSRRRYQLGLVVLFLAFLAAPLVTTVIEVAQGSTPSPGDVCSAPPPLGAGPAELRKFPGALKWYFSKGCFGLKASLVRLHGHAMVRVLGTSSTPKVLLGRDGWLFAGFDRVLDSRRGSSPLTPEQLRDWLGTLERRQAALEAQNIDYAFVVTPDPHTIYPEYLPRNVATAGPSRLDQLKEAWTRTPHVHFVDVRPTLFANKQHARLYYRTDTHWNPLAGWLATREIASRLGLSGLPEGLLPLRSRPLRGGDLARLLGLANSYEDEEIWPAAEPPKLLLENGELLTLTLTNVVFRDRVVVLNEGGTGTAVVFRDSFGEAMMPWLSSLFKRTVWVRSYVFDEQLVEAERPDVVIEQMVERKLMSLIRPGGGLLDDPFVNPEGS